jgi:hypothetical protein
MITSLIVVAKLLQADAAFLSASPMRLGWNLLFIRAAGLEKK